MLKKLVNEAKFSLKLITTGPVLIRSGHATLSGPDMTPVLTYRHGERQVYFPGSSLKGVFRSYLEKVGRTLNEGAICNPFDDTSCGARLKARKDEEERKKKEEIEEPITNEVIYRDSCPICRLFGSTFFIGRVNIGDAYLINELQPRPTELRDGVGIDRLTGGAAHGAKFDLEAISSGVEFSTEIYLCNFECWQLGMLMVMVQDLADGLLRVGSGTSRGLGSVRGEVNEVMINHLGNLSAKPNTEIWGLGKFLGPGSAYGTHPDDMLQLENMPETTQRGIRFSTFFKGEQLQALQLIAGNTYITHLQQVGRAI